MFQRAVVPVVVASLLMPLLYAEQAPQAPAGKITLVIVGGNDTINNIKQRTARETIVEVQDENHRPVAGAAVTFLLPDSGPGGAFAGGSRSVSLVTGSNGRVVMPRMTANQLTGQFQIRVSAAYQGQTASATVSQQNAAAAANAGHAGLSGKAIAIIAGVAAAGAAAGAIAATRGGGTPTGTISAGAVTAGPPR
jgi:hypothetical protein